MRLLRDLVHIVLSTAKLRPLQLIYGNGTLPEPSHAAQSGTCTSICNNLDLTRLTVIPDSSMVSNAGPVRRKVHGMLKGSQSKWNREECDSPIWWEGRKIFRHLADRGIREQGVLWNLRGGFRLQRLELEGASKTAVAQCLVALTVKGTHSVASR